MPVGALLAAPFALRLSGEGALFFSEPSIMVKKVLVLGGGIAGITAALALGDAGYEVILVERLPAVGGRMLQLAETFPTLDCAQCTLTPKTAEIARHPNIRLITYAEVEQVTGEAGNFLVEIRQKASYVDGERCTGCGLCLESCPVELPAEFERGMGTAKAIYTLAPQAVPNKPVIVRACCRYFRDGKCRLCERVCTAGAIDYGQQDRLVTEKIGAVIVATGYDLLPIERFGEYGRGTLPDVIDGLAFERLLSASGPTGGVIRRPSDGKIPREVAFIQCAGSRDPERHLPYCSRICCMYTAKHARLYRQKVPEGQAYIFYMDLRPVGKGYEEFIQRGMAEEGLIYLRGRVSRIYRNGDRLIIAGADTLTGKKIELAADMAVLATAMKPRDDAKEVAAKLGIVADAQGFFQEAEKKLRPVETTAPGIYMAGAASGPRDISDTVAQAGAAAAEVQALFARLPAKNQR